MNYAIPENQVESVSVSAVQYGVKLTIVTKDIPEVGVATFEMITRINRRNGLSDLTLAVDGATWLMISGPFQGDDERQSAREFRDAWRYYAAIHDETEYELKEQRLTSGREIAARLFSVTDGDQ